MRGLAALVLLLLTLVGWSQSAPVTIQPDDVIKVTVYGTGEPETLRVLQDGTVSGTPYGVVKVSGLTVGQAATKIKERTKAYIKNPVVFVTLVEQAQHFVFVVGTKSSSTRVPWKDGMDLRSVVSVSEMNESVDRLEAHLFRQGKEVGRANVGRLLSGKSGEFNDGLKPGDVISVTPVTMIRVWLLDKFSAPGEKVLIEGTTLVQAVAQAGGVKLTAPTGVVVDQAAFESQSRINVLRGGNATEFKLGDVEAMAGYVLQPGDTVTVKTPDVVTVSIAGSIKEAGTMNLVAGADLMDVVVRSQGPTESGSLADVLVVRKDKVVAVDLTKRYQGEPGTPFPVQDGDLIVVQESKQAYYVLGDVNSPGRYLYPQDRSVSAADALATAKGLNDKGTLRRVMLARKNAKGEYEVTEFNLDEFLRDGKVSSNVQLQPGDFILFTHSRGITVNNLLQLLPTAILLRGLGG